MCSTITINGHDEDEPEDESVKGGKAATWSSVELVTPRRSYQNEEVHCLYRHSYVIVNMLTWECL